MMRVDFLKVNGEHKQTHAHTHACTRKNNLGGLKALVEIDHVTK